MVMFRLFMWLFEGLVSVMKVGVFGLIVIVVGFMMVLVLFSCLWKLLKFRLVVVMVL